MRCLTIHKKIGDQSIQVVWIISIKKTVTIYDWWNKSKKYENNKLGEIADRMSNVLSLGVPLFPSGLS